MNKYAAILALLTFILSGGYGLYEHSTYTRIKSELDQVDCGPAYDIESLTCELRRNSDELRMERAEANRNYGFAFAIGGPVVIWLLALLWRAKSPKLKRGAKQGGRMAVDAGRIALDELSKRSARATKDVVGAVAQISDSAQGRTRECPFCAEMIKPQAKVCRHCGKDVG